MLPISFNAVYSIPGIENEMDIPAEIPSWKCFPCHSMQFTQFQV